MGELKENLKKSKVEQYNRLILELQMDKISLLADVEMLDKKVEILIKARGKVEGM